MFYHIKLWYQVRFLIFPCIPRVKQRLVCISISFKSLDQIVYFWFRLKSMVCAVSETSLCLLQCTIEMKSGKQIIFPFAIISNRPKDVQLIDTFVSHDDIAHHSTRNVILKRILGAIWPSLSPCTVINPILLTYLKRIPFITISYWILSKGLLLMMYQHWLKL